MATTRKKIAPHKPKHKKGLRVDKLTVIWCIGHYKPKHHTSRKKQHHYLCWCSNERNHPPMSRFWIVTQEAITKFLAKGVATCPKCARSQATRKPFVRVSPEPFVALDAPLWPATVTGYSSAWMEGDR